jgi:histidine ammonia-lyase
VDSIPTSADQEDHVSMSANAARHLSEIVWNSKRVVAIELIAAAQGIDLRVRNLGRGSEMLGQGTRVAHAIIRSEIPYLDKDRILAPDIEKATALIEAGTVLAALRSE